MSIKKIKRFAFIFTLIFIVALSGCAPKIETTTTDTTTQPANQQVPTAEKVNVVKEAVLAYFADVPSDKNIIDPKSFMEKVKKNEDMFILDIRSADSYNKGHIKGAVNIPFGPELGKALDKLPKDKPILITDDTGQTGNQLVLLLRVAGFNATQVKLGWDLGISKLSNMNDVIETTANSFPASTPLDIQPEMKEAIVKYFDSLGDAQNTIYADFILSEAEANKIIESKDSSILFVDLRKPDDYKGGHIDGAVNIVYKSGKNSNDALFDLPQDKKIVPL